MKPNAKRALLDQVTFLLATLEQPTKIASEPAGRQFFVFQNVTYELPGGWSMVVYFDQTDWDYVDHFVAPDGTMLDPDDDALLVDGRWDPVFHWLPSTQHRAAWGAIDWSGVGG